jgi:hypothetical protein
LCSVPQMVDLLSAVSDRLNCCVLSPKWLIYCVLSLIG